MPKLFVATGIPPLDRYLAGSSALNEKGFEVLAPAFNTAQDLVRAGSEALKNEDVSTSTPVAVLSSAVSGKGRAFEDEVLYPVRALGYRVVLLPGNPAEPSTMSLVRFAAGIGIFDFVFDPYTGQDVIKRIISPSTVNAVRELLAEGIKDMRRVDSDDGQDRCPESGVKEPGKGAKFRIKVKAANSVNYINGKLQKLTSGAGDRSGAGIGVMAGRNEKAGGAGPAAPDGNQEEIAGGKTAVIAVWSPGGHFKSYTALNLAFYGKSALLNFDFTCPELDVWFGIRQTGVKDGVERDAGIMTLGENMNPELVPRMLRVIKKWGIRYLPAGSKLGNIGTPDFGENAAKLFLDIIDKARGESSNGSVVIDAGRDMELPATFAALSGADIIVIPLAGVPQEAEVVSWQLGELARVGIEKPVLELVFSASGEGLEKFGHGSSRGAVLIDYRSYIESALRGEVGGTEGWDRVIDCVQRLLKDC